MSNLLVSDEKIKVSKSSFSIFPNELSIFEGRKEKMHISNLSIKIKNKRCGFDALLYEVLNVVYELNFSTTRQITEYLDLTKKHFNISQEDVFKRLEALRRNGVVDRYSFSSEDSNAETGMKVFAITELGRILLQGRGFICNYKYTDNLFTDRIKKYLIRNQYIIKLIKDKGLNYKDINLRSGFYGVDVLYTIDSIHHIVIPSRRYEDFEDDFRRVLNGLLNSALVATSSYKIIVLAEDVRHCLNLYQIAHECGVKKEFLYFVQDLRLFDRELSKSFVRFGIIKENGQAKLVMQEESIKELQV